MNLDKQLDDVLGILNEVGDWFTKTYKKECTIEFKERPEKQRIEFFIMIQTSAVSFKELGFYCKYTDFYDLPKLAQTKQQLRVQLQHAMRKAMPNEASATN